MAFTPETAAIRTDAALTEAISKAVTTEQITQLLHDAALRQKLVTPDPMDATILHATELSEHSPRSFARTVTVNGTKHFVESETEQGLDVAETELLKKLMAQPKVDDTEAEQRRDATGRFVAEQDAAAFDEAQQAAYQNLWKAATVEFISRHPEHEGGNDAVKRFGEKIIELGLQDQPTVVTLERAYAELKRTNSLPQNPEARRMKEQYDAIASATCVEDIRRLAGGHNDRGYESEFNWR